MRAFAVIPYCSPRDRNDVGGGVPSLRDSFGTVVFMLHPPVSAPTQPQPPTAAQTRRLSPRVASRVTCRDTAARIPRPGTAVRRILGATNFAQTGAMPGPERLPRVVHGGQPEEQAQAESLLSSAWRISKARRRSISKSGHACAAPTMSPSRWRHFGCTLLAAESRTITITCHRKLIHP